MAKPKERPILFSAAMVAAILAGRKTVTRRSITPDWLRCLDPEDADDRAAAVEQCRYGRPGDRLWVREKWALEDCGEDGPRVVWAADRAAAWVESNQLDEIHWLPSDYKPSRWRSSIHMPRWASRILLEVVSVRVERLHAITEEDARAEGVERSVSGYWHNYAVSGPTHQYARASFCSLWAAINGAESWDANPWVWVVGFRKLAL